MFSAKVVYAGSADQMALFPVRQVAALSRVTLAIAGLSCYPRDGMRRAGLCDSVRPSHADIVSKRKAMISSPSANANSPVCENIRLIPKFERGHPERRRFLRLGWLRTGDFGDFSTYSVSRGISGTVQDRTKVTIEH